MIYCDVLPINYRCIFVYEPKLLTPGTMRKIKSPLGALVMNVIRFVQAMKVNAAALLRSGKSDNSQSGGGICHKRLFRENLNAVPTQRV